MQKTEETFDAMASKNLAKQYGRNNLVAQKQQEIFYIIHIQGTDFLLVNRIFNLHMFEFSAAIQIM